MKKLTALILAGMALGIVACRQKEEKKSEDIIAPKYEAPKPKAPIKMQSYTQEMEFTVDGRKMKSVILRQADDSLKMVQDEIGQKFVDNRITVTVTREDGSIFYKSSFIKDTFCDYLTDTYRSDGILEGLVHDRVEGSNILFAASVCIPQTDEYIPLEMTLGKGGSMSIKRATQMETLPEDEL